MVINSDKPIFIQLAEVIKRRIIDGELQPDDKIPSVRELAAEFEVNNNTAMHAVEYLSRQDIIYQKRGVGYFVNASASENIVKQRRENFFNNTLPEVIQEMKILGIGIDEISAYYNNTSKQ
ncbi:MAG: GntR family transcriptional regulator [Bacteroidales bacterium]|nr:GntR family transcriptional regulator [Bacteroidales bacterium]